MRFTKNKEVLLIILAMIISFFVITAFFGKPFWLGIIAIFCFLAFTATKAISFSLAASENKKYINSWFCAKMFFIGDFVEAISFTGKIGSDASKAFLLRQYFNIKIAITKTIIFRFLTIICTPIILIILLSPIYGSIILAGIILIIFWKNKQLALSMIANLVSESVRLALLIALIVAFGIAPSTNILLFLVLANAIGRLVAITPHGIGIQDSLIGALFYSTLPIDMILQLNVLLRMYTIVPSAVIGGTLSSKGVLDKMRQFKKAHKETKLSFAVIGSYFKKNMAEIKKEFSKK